MCQVALPTASFCFQVDVVVGVCSHRRHPMNENVQLAAPVGGGTAEPPRTRNWWALPLVIAALTVLTMRVPQEVVKGVIAHSWNASLVYAHVNGFRFGDDVVFPSGPLGYLAINHFVPNNAMPCLLLGLLTTTLTVTGLCACWPGG